MKRHPHLTPGEFELMEILWPLGEGSVKDVWGKVDPARGLAYTTVMTVLEKMYRKGILSQRKRGKAYLYSPNIKREEALGSILQYLCDVYFQGSREELIRFVETHYKNDTPEPASKTGRDDVTP